MKLKLALGIALFVVLAAAVIRPLFSPPHAVARPERTTTPILPAEEVGPVPSVSESTLSPEGTDDPAPKRLNIAELRAGVRSGDSDRVADVGGEPAPEDAEELFMLIAEIPGEASRLDRNRIIKSLMKLLRSVPGEESSLLLMHSLRRDGFIPQVEWIRVARELAKRGHAGTFSYLESVAFSSEGLARYSAADTRTYLAAELLVKKDAERYVPAVVQRVRDSTGPTFSGYLGALAHAGESAHPDIGKLIPHLQERYRDLPAGSEDCYEILKVVTNYVIGSKSETLRQWVTAELAREDFKYEDEMEKELMKIRNELLLRQLELAGR